jgi:hypothetical protein
MAEFPPLTQGDIVLEDGSETLWRNVPPGFFDNGRMTSQAFHPTLKDAGKVSVGRASQVSAQKHFEEFVSDLGLQSVGIWAVHVQAVRETGGRAVDDQEGQERPDPCLTGHAYIDFRDCETQNQRKKRAGRLRDVAELDGISYAPPTIEGLDSSE